LTHDQELTATGSATKIKYGQDYDFYLERLFKRSSWAISVMDYYNREVFGTSSVSASLSAPSSTSQPRTWEDDFLQQLEAPAPAPPAPAPAAPAPAPAPTASTLSAHVTTPTGHTNIVSNHHAIMSISQRGTASATAQLQVDIGQLSLENDTEPSTLNGRRLPTARPRRTASIRLAQPGERSIDEDVVPIVPLAPPPAVKRRAARGRPKKSEK